MSDKVPTLAEIEASLARIAQCESVSCVQCEVLRTEAMNALLAMVRARDAELAASRQRVCELEGALREIRDQPFYRIEDARWMHNRAAQEVGRG